ncbi:MAG: hypothetical protein WC773_00705 [Patescibacteria group bacterium]|jgi:hypothetical protein
MKELDGICEECGNTGIVGDSCSFCGNKIMSLDDNLDTFDDDEDDIPVQRKSKKSLPEDDIDELSDFDDIDDIDEPIDIDEDIDVPAEHESLDEMAFKEEKEQNSESDLAKMNKENEDDET